MKQKPQQATNRKTYNLPDIFIINIFDSFLKDACPSIIHQVIHLLLAIISSCYFCICSTNQTKITLLTQLSPHCGIGCWRCQRQAKSSCSCGGAGKTGCQDTEHAHIFSASSSKTCPGNCHHWAQWKSLFQRLRFRIPVTIGQDGKTAVMILNK